MSYWAEIALFSGKAVIVVIVVVAIVTLVASVIAKAKGVAPGKDGRLAVKHLNQSFADNRDQMRFKTMEKKVLKQLTKQEKKKQKKNTEEKKGKLFVIDFHGDIKASAAKNLSTEISVILSVASPEDEVLVKLESAGGMVHSYGFATAQLERITNHGTKLTVAVDKVAASGGYMMACVADMVIAAPFAVIGSIGVIAQMPNINRLLKKNNIDIEQHTAGKYKRTLTLLGENTNKGRSKFLEDLEKTHELFKSHVAKHRKELDVSEVATGEVWYGSEALDKKLIDRLGTSEEYLFKAVNNDIDIYHVKWEAKKKGLLGKLGKGAENTATKAVDAMWDKLTDTRFFL